MKVPYVCHEEPHFAEASQQRFRRSISISAEQRWGNCSLPGVNCSFCRLFFSAGHCLSSFNPSLCCRRFSRFNEFRTLVTVSRATTKVAQKVCDEELFDDNVLSFSAKLSPLKITVNNSISDNLTKTKLVVELKLPRSLYITLLFCVGYVKHQKYLYNCGHILAL